MLVLRGDMLHDLEASPDTPDGVAAIAGEQVREDAPLTMVERDEPPAEDEADGSEQRQPAFGLGTAESEASPRAASRARSSVRSRGTYPGPS